jgi:glutaredoxin
MVKKYLTVKGVEYEAVDVTNDAAKRQELLEKTGMMSVPVTTDGENFVVGFKPAELAKLVS